MLKTERLEDSRAVKLEELRVKRGIGDLWEQHFGSPKGSNWQFRLS